MPPPSASTPLHQQDPTGRFSDRASDYVKYRPGYPAAAIDAILDGLAAPGSLTAVDIGAGTGISARLLAERGVHVLAIEPNAAMRAAAGPHPFVEFRDGAAEATGLGDQTVDLVLAAQAFHWVNPPPALREFHRVLKPAGRLSLMWNIRDEGDPFTAGYTQAIRDITGEQPAETRGFDPRVVAAEGLFEHPSLREFASGQAMTLDGMLGRASSASYVPKDPGRWGELRDRLTVQFDRHRDASGLVRMRYVTRVYTAARLGESSSSRP